MSIYVEILVRAPMDALWSHTQTPALHERWDLRFSRIEYLPISGESEPQRFQYATRIGFGLEISGEGETVGRRDSTDGSSTSALKFGSDEPLSIIRAAGADLRAPRDGIPGGFVHSIDDPSAIRRTA